MVDDPTPDKRVYYRSREDGQRGYVVRRDGKDVIRLDRPMEEIIRKFEPALWERDHQEHALTSHAVAAIAFVADRALCKALGTHLKTHEQEWLSLKESARVKWMTEGPNSEGIRDDLYDAIMGTLGRLTDG